MDQDDAVALIARGVEKDGGVWADLGAGSGTFTHALASLLGPSGTVYAVDRNPSSLRHLSGAMKGQRRATIRTVVGDFTAALDLPRLDGVVLANSLHYVPYPNQANVLRRIASLLADDAPLVIVEYDRRAANQWVPYPVTPAALAQVAHEAGLGEPVMLATRPSRYSGRIYSALVRRSDG